MFLFVWVWNTRKCVSAAHIRMYVYEHVHDHDTVISVCNNVHLHFFDINNKIFTSQELRSAPRLNCALDYWVAERTRNNLDFHLSNSTNITLFRLEFVFISFCFSICDYKHFPNKLSIFTTTPPPFEFYYFHNSHPDIIFSSIITSSCLLHVTSAL